jgi:hypothetical protein
MPSNECPSCGHWPYNGSHGEAGCHATAGTLKPCGCRHKEPKRSK